jgi:hypothetical protein
MASKTTTALGQSRQWGRVEVFPSAVAAIAGHASLDCYGIAGMAARGLRDGVAELLHRGNVSHGVEVIEVEGGIVIDLYVIVQYGIRISEVAHTTCGDRQVRRRALGQRAGCGGQCERAGRKGRTALSHGF